VGQRPEWSRASLRGSATWRLAELTFNSGSTRQVTFAVEFDRSQNASDEGVGLDDISMKEGLCTGGG